MSSSFFIIFNEVNYDNTTLGEVLYAVATSFYKSIENF